MKNLRRNALYSITIIISLIYFSNAIIAQTFKVSGVIINSETTEIVPYANLMVLNNVLGVSTDMSGYFELILPDSLRNDTLVISSVGFLTKRICINDNDYKIIELTPQIISLSEVIIKPSPNKKKLVRINSFDLNDCSVMYSLKPFEGQGNLVTPYRAKEPSIEAIYFPYKPKYIKTEKIKDVSLCLTNYKSTPTYFRLRFFSAEENHTPGNDLLTKPLLVEVPPRKQITKISLEEFNLLFPETGLFIGIELLIIPENRREI